MVHSDIDVETWVNWLSFWESDDMAIAVVKAWYIVAVASLVNAFRRGIDRAA